MRKEKLLNIGIYGLLLGLFALGIFIYEHFYNDPIHHPRGKYRPILNPNPKYFMTVQGNINTGHYSVVKITANYYSTLEACKVEENPLVGALYNRKQTTHYTADQIGSGTFKIKIPLDLYKPDYCKWHIGDIHYSLRGREQKAIANFALITKPKWLRESDYKNLKTLNASDTFIFKKNNYVFKTGKSFGTNTVPIRNDLTFTINVEKK